MFNIYNAHGTVVETADTHIEALNVVTYLSTYEKHSGPYHCAPAELVTA